MKSVRRVCNALLSYSRLCLGLLLAVPAVHTIAQAHAAAADEESRRKRTAERSRRLAEVQKQQAALEQAQASALQVGLFSGLLLLLKARMQAAGFWWLSRLVNSAV